MTDQLPTEDHFSQHVDWRLWGKVFRHAMAAKGYVYGMVGASLLTSGCDALFGLVTRQAIDTAVRKDPAGLMRYGVIYAGLTLTICLSIWTIIIMAGRISTSMSHAIRREAFAKLQELSFAYFDRRPVGWLMARLTSDCKRLADIIAWGSLTVLWSSSVMLGMALIMLWLDWKLALIVLAVAPALIVVSKYFQRLILISSRAVRKLNSLITGTYNEGIMGVRTTKTLLREEANLGEFRDLSRQMYAASVANALYSALYLPIVLTVASAGTGLALWFGGRGVLAGSLSLGTLVAFITYSGQFFNPINELARIFTELQSAQASAERVLELLETEPEIQDSPEVRQAIAANLGRERREGIAPDGGEEEIREIEFRHVGFAYKDGPAVLKDFCLKVRAGQTIALVGPTGGGKSTIASLLCRFYEPTAGEILMNGVDYRRRSLRWLQSNLGIVLQTPHLFSGTIRENIRYGNLAASDGQIEQAARLVDAHGFIMAREGGYDSPVGEGGVNLSTGQKQLISFARAILADPQIFVMDEATSSVDTQTEQLIQHGIETLLKGRTSFIIAHRLSTIRCAAQILVIEQGRIAEQGSHRELIRRRGIYYDLYTNQFAQEKAEAILEEEAEEAQGAD